MGVGGKEILFMFSRLVLQFFGSPLLGTSPALLLESVYQSKAGLNETQRDANVTVLLIDQWSAGGTEEEKKQKTGRFSLH